MCSGGVDVYDLRKDVGASHQWGRHTPHLR